MAILWQWIFHAEVGPVNYLLGRIGIVGPGLLSAPDWAIPSIIIIDLRGSMGGSRMLIFLAGLQGVPQELYDAAAIDGAGSGANFHHVTLPMISPTLFFNLIMGIIGSLKVFAMAYVATDGGPSRATWFYALHLYNWAFQYFEMGYAAALAWIFAVILMSTDTVAGQALRASVFNYAGGEQS